MPKSTILILHKNTLHEKYTTQKAISTKNTLGMPSKKYYLDREFVPISSDTPTNGPVSEHLDREYW